MWFFPASHVWFPKGTMLSTIDTSILMQPAATTTKGKVWKKVRIFGISRNLKRDRPEARSKEDMHQRTNWFHPASTRRHWFFPWSFAWHDVTSESTRHEHCHAIAIATLTFWKYLEMISSPQLQLKTNPTCPTEFTVAITAPTVDLSVVHQRCKASGLAN